MICVLIPARAGSKRVPGKNMKMAGGVPLIVHTISLALQLEGSPPVYISTDSSEIGRIAKAYGAIYIDRPDEFALDDSEDVDVVSHFLGYEGLQEATPRFIVYLRPTTPVRRLSLVDEAIKRFIEIADVELPPTSMRSVHEMSESAFKCVTMIGNLLTAIGAPDHHYNDFNRPNHYNDFNRPNDAYIKTYQCNGYVDIIRPEFIQGRDLWGPRIMGFQTPPVIEIDTEFDFELLEYQLQARGVY